MNITEKVKEKLIHAPVFRDDDQSLIISIWRNELIKKGYKSFAVDFTLLEIINLTPAASITRARRKIQELSPELRGDSYEKRQEKQAKIKKQLRENSSID